MPIINENELMDIAPQISSQTQGRIINESDLVDVAPREQSLMSMLAGRASDFGNAFSPPAQEGRWINPSNPVNMAGAVAGGIGDVIGAGIGGIGAGIKSAYKGIVPESTRQEINKGIVPAINAIAPPLMPILQGISEVTPAISEGYGDLKKQYPEGVKTAESLGNIASLLPIGKGASLGKQAVGGMVEAASLSMAKQKGADFFRQEASNTIKTEFPKIFKMPSSLKKDYRASKQFLDKADNSMYDIVKNEHPDFPIKGSGNAPLTNYAENLTMRKQQNWDEIEGMIKNTGIDTQIAQKEFIGELQKVINTSGVSSVTETEKRSALKMMESITENPNITLGDAQAQLQGLNKALGGSIPYDVAGTAKIDNMYRDFLKKTIDAKVQALPDNAGFKDLKKLWGSHREVEDTIIKTLNDSLGKSQKLNFIDITSGSLALSSILTQNPHMLLSVGLGEALNIARRLSGDINRSLVKLTDRVRKSQTMESKVREALSKNKPKADPLGLREGKP